MLAILNRRAVDFNRGPMRLLSKRANLRLHRSRSNTKERSKDNIHAHYDLGNEFFALFLDETLAYSSAVFAYDGQPLADAQREKCRRMCEFARIGPSSRVLEIGGGWGGFALYAAAEHGCRVTSLTISQEQCDLASKRVRDAGLESLVDIRLTDYRDAEGAFDAIVSIEMFEAVGAEYFETFFRKCESLLEPGGVLAMQVITVPDRNFAAQKRGVNWIQKHVFPGGVLPSLAEMERANAGTTLAVASLDHIGRHYAVTLRQWRETFWERVADVRRQGYDERFIRTWNYYLAACEAGFLSGAIDDLQIAFEKPAAP